MRRLPTRLLHNLLHSAEHGQNRRRIDDDIRDVATAAAKRRRLTTARARQLVTDFEQVTIRELAIDILRAVDLGLELGIDAYDAYILEAARSSGFPLLALDGPIRRNAKKLGLSLVELDV